MIIQRNIESELLRWKNAENRKPVILRGARQVGKTFVVNQFAANFENFIRCPIIYYRDLMKQLTSL